MIVNVVLVAVLCTVFRNCDARTNDSVWDAKRTKHDEIMSVEDIGYYFQHAYRTVLRNGLPGLTEATRSEITRECGMDLFNISAHKELLVQCIY